MLLVGRKNGKMEESMPAISWPQGARIGSGLSPQTINMDLYGPVPAYQRINSVQIERLVYFGFGSSFIADQWIREICQWGSGLSCLWRRSK